MKVLILQLREQAEYDATADPKYLAASVTGDVDGLKAFAQTYTDENDSDPTGTLVWKPWSDDSGQWYTDTTIKPKTSYTEWYFDIGVVESIDEVVIDTDAVATLVADMQALRDEILEAKG